MSQPAVQINSRGIRKERVGEVLSDRMEKTIVVWIERRFRHPKYSKEMTVGKKYYAHDEKEEASVGDQVRIEETRPLSRLKRWRLVEIVRKSKRVTTGLGTDTELAGVAKPAPAAAPEEEPKAAKPAAAAKSKPKRAAKKGAKAS